MTNTTSLTPHSSPLTPDVPSGVFCLDASYATTRLVTQEMPIIQDPPDAAFKSMLFLPPNPDRKGEGGLRTQGYFKCSLPDKPLITVITVVFNGAQHLEDTIKSVINQTYDNVEYLIVDGGSTDGTQDIIRRYEGQIDYWVSEKDQGIYDAWNKGVKVAKGGWLCFIGAGDFLLPDALQEYVRYLSNNPNLEYVSGRVELFDGAGGTRIIGKPWQWASFRRYMCVAHVGSLHARSLFATSGQFDPSYRICGDYELLLRAGSHLRAGYVDYVFARMCAGGISSTNRGALNEARAAKIQTQAVPSVVALWDHCVAAVKWQVRRILGRI